MIFGGRLFRNRITPLDSMTYTAENADTFHLVVIGPARPPSHHDRHVISSSCMCLRSACRSVSLLTPRRANGMPSNRLTSDRSWGYIARQGPYHDPQKWSTTTLPR